MKNKRFYTLFRLENGDEIPLSFRSEKALNEFINEHKTYQLIKSSNAPLYFELANSPDNRHDFERMWDLFSRKFGELHKDAANFA